MAFRIDIGQLQSPKKLSDGRLVAEGLLTRAGVFIYRNPDGSERRELRLPEEVFKADALESFSLAPLTNEHPPELMTVKNAKRYAVGTVGENIKRDGDHVRARLTVYDAETIAQMESGKAYLSCGYEVELDNTPGTHPQYGRYDAIQRKICGNHVAIVSVGRAGEAARVRMDAAVMQHEPPKRSHMAEKITQEAYDVVAGKLAAAEKRADAAEKERDAAKAQADEAKGQIESLKEKVTAVTLEKERQDSGERDAQIRALQARLDEAEKARIDAEDPDRLRKAVASRAKLETQAATVLGGRIRFDTLTDREVMVAVLERLGKSADLKDASDPYVKGRFDTAVESYLDGEKALDRLRASTAPAPAEGRTDHLRGRELMIARNRGLAPQEQE